MLMRFCGGGVGHSSTRAATDSFKNDRDQLDKISQQHRKDSHIQRNTDTGMEESDSNGIDHNDNEMNTEMSTGERKIDGEVDEESELSESELIDYGYEPEGDLELYSDEDDDDRESGEEDDTTVEEFGSLEDYGDY